MKLTKNLRDAFVRAAMNDVPKVDYCAQAQIVMQKDALKSMPAKVRAIHTDPTLRDYLRTTVVRLPGDGWYYASGNQVAVYGMVDFTPSLDAKQQVEALGVGSSAQTKRINELKTKLTAAAYAVTSRKALVDMLPEFEKYLPEDAADACKTLPAVANLLSDFVKAGWPKDGRKKPSIKPVAVTA